MAARFVNGQEQLRRIDDDVVASRVDGFRRQFFDDVVTGLFGIGEPWIVFGVLVANQLGAIDARVIEDRVIEIGRASCRERV